LAPVPGELVERLYALPLDRFTVERNALAKRLRKDGQRDEAAAVEKLRKPTVPVWAVNRLAHEREEELEELLKTADRMRREPGAAAEDFRRALDRLARAAPAVLEQGGHAASETTVQRVVATLRAGAAATGEERDALARGILDRELEPQGFEAMAGLAPPPAKRAAGAKKPASREREARRKRIAEAKEGLAAARAEARERRREADAAEREAERARSAAERADAAVERAKEALERLEAGD
jgi:hypothetical protein